MSDVTIVELPKLYENMDEATIGAWQVEEGARVSAGDYLVELITDKTVVEFEAPKGGVLLRIYGSEKSTVPQGYALCAIGEEGAEAPDLTASNEAKIADHVKAQTGGIDVSSLGLGPAADPAPARPSFKAAPAAKAFARQQGIDLAEVAAFCGRGMVHRKDVEDFIRSRPGSGRGRESSAPSPSDSAPPTPSSRADEFLSSHPESGLTASSAIPCSTEAVGIRVALVTGGTGGIGSAIVRRLAASGTAIAIHTCHDLSGAEALSRELTKAGVLNGVFPADLSGSDDACQKLVDAVQARFGRLDILVNNAGCLADGTVSFMSDGQWDQVLNLCLTVPFRLIRACSMGMARRRWGRIVNISSDAGRMGSANRSNYASAKEGLCGLTRSAALELGGMGVRVNAVSPGFIDSPMTADMPEKRKHDLLRGIPVRRFGRPEDVASLVGFLCSEESDYVTGQVISVNGGLCM